MRLPMETVIRGLPATQREILIETYFLGRTPLEAAEHLGIPLAEAKARLYEAVHQLAYLTGATTPTRRYRRDPVKETTPFSMDLHLDDLAVSPTLVPGGRKS